jgi:hypothetical protein
LQGLRGVSLLQGGPRPVIRANSSRVLVAFSVAGETTGGAASLPEGITPGRTTTTSPARSGRTAATAAGSADLT